jgi:hypothetical protein
VRSFLLPPAEYLIREEEEDEQESGMAAGAVEQGLDEGSEAQEMEESEGEDDYYQASKKQGKRLKSTAG